MVAPSFSLSQIIDQLDSGAHWNNSVITYSFRTGRHALTEEQVNAASEAMNLWADVANITVVNVGDGRSGNITFGNKSLDDGIGQAKLPTFGNALLGKRGNVWFDTDAGENSYLAPGQLGFKVMLHEIGHALGLYHPGDYNGTRNGRPTYEDDAEYRQDSQQYTLMSYFSSAETGAIHYGSSAATPLLHDIAAIQSIYGVNWSTRNDDTVYGFNSTANRDAFDFTINNIPVIAIWDGGGHDTLDVSGYNYNQVIDLNDGAFSDIGGLTKNVAIAFDAMIEDAIGGAGHDRIYGNELGNLLMGGQGNDSLYGNQGRDVLYGGEGNDRLEGGSGWDRLDGGLGNDVLLGGAGEDHLYGGKGTDYLNGGLGDDHIYAGSGTDYHLIGGAGEDVFHFSIGNGSNYIRDFTIGEDLLEFKGLGLDDFDINSSWWGDDQVTLTFQDTSITLVGVSASELVEDMFI